MFSELLGKYKNGEVSYEKLKTMAAQYDQLYENAKFLCSLGTPIKSNKEFQRVHKKVTDTIAYCIAGIDLSDGGPLMVPTDLYDKKEALEVAKKVTIKYPWLNGDL